MRKLKMKISGAFRIHEAAQAFATLRSVVATARKQGWNILQTLATNPRHKPSPQILATCKTHSPQPQIPRELRCAPITID
jgi:hypothetical protein